MQNDRALLLYNNIAKQFTPLSKTCVVGVVGVANLCEIDYSQFKWDLVVWRKVLIPPENLCNYLAVKSGHTEVAGVAR